MSTRSKKITVQEAVTKMQNSKGKFMTVSFIKRSNNELRTMNCRTGVSKGVKGTKKSRKGTGLMTVFDMTKKNFRNVNVSGIRQLKLNGQTYKVV
jgi:hypothetical protein